MMKKIAAIMLLLAFSSVAYGTTYNVITPTADVSQPGSLPWCIFYANQDAAPDIIEFNHAQALDPATNSITVHTTLMITYPVRINGNQIKIGAHDGTGSNPQNVFQLIPGSSGSTITGLSIVDSSAAIRLASGSDNNFIYGNRIGTDWNDTSGLGNTYGVLIYSTGNVIGGTTGGFRNVISDNANIGIGLYAGSSLNYIIGNYIGTNNGGTAQHGTQSSGVYVNGGQQNLIGGNQSAGYGNVISGNTTYGIVMESIATIGNTICGNTIGLNAEQNTAVPNSNGIAGTDMQGNYIGLPQSGFENIIAGNTTNNVYFYQGAGSAPQYNKIQNNYIGTNSSGATFTNGNGIYFSTAHNNWIGGDRSASQGNVISGNGNNGGIYLIGDSNSVCGNYIGTNPAGTTSLSNSAAGIRLSGDHNMIGNSNGSGRRYGNVISGNSGSGLLITGGENNAVFGNIIGLDETGTISLGSQTFGIYFNAAGAGNQIGMNDSDIRNIISGNSSQGIWIGSTSLQQVVGNYIGVNSGGSSVVQNGSESMRINNSSQNLVQDNYLTGVINIYNAGSFGNTLVGNKIGILPDGSAVSGTFDGIAISGGASNNMIGNSMTGYGNLISNALDGIIVSGSTTLGNGYFANTITACSSTTINNLNSGNNEYAIPVITAANSATGITGTAQANDYIEVFVAENIPGGYGGSVRFIGYTIADGSGNWSLYGGVLSAGEYVCATATDVNNNTSEYSLNVLALGPPTPTPTVTSTTTSTGTPTFTATVSPTITLTPTISVTSTISPTPTASNTMTPEATVTATPTPTVTVTTTSFLNQVDLKGKVLLAYPNPADQSIVFVLHLQEAAVFELRIYNLSGERIATVAADLPEGLGQQVQWDCSSVAPGIYFVKVMKNGQLEETQKIAIVH